jgi:hypothetical protein
MRGGNNEFFSSISIYVVNILKNYLINYNLIYRNTQNVQQKLCILIYLCVFSVIFYFQVCFLLFHTGPLTIILSFHPTNKWSGKKYLNSELTIRGLIRFEKSLMQPESMVINLYSTTDGKERNIFELPGGIKKLITRQAVQLTRSSWLSSSIVQRSTTWICKDFLQVSASCTSSCYTRYVMSVSDIPMPTRFQQIKQEVCGQFDSRIQKKRQSSRISKTISYIFSNNK